MNIQTDNTKHERHVAKAFSFAMTYGTSFLSSVDTISIEEQKQILREFRHFKHRPPRRSYHSVIVTYWDKRKIRTRTISDRNYPPRHPQWFHLEQPLVEEVAASGCTMVFVRRKGFMVPKVVHDAIEHWRSLPGLTEVPLRDALQRLVPE